MHFVTTVAGETLEALVARAYDVPAGAPKAVAKRAQTAIVDANPFLKAMDAVPDATIVAVPDVEGATASAATDDADRTALGAAVSQFSGTAPAALEAILGDLRQTAAETAGSLELLRSPELRKLARENEQLRAALPAMNKLASARIDAQQRLETMAREALAQVQSELDGLRDAFA